MLAREYEDELEFEDELEGEFEDEFEFEDELEGEFEDELFFGRIADFARRQWGALQTPGTPQRNLAIQAATAAVNQGLPAAGAAAGGAAGRALGGAALGAIPYVGAALRPAGQWAGGALGTAGGRWLGGQAANWARQFIPQREFEGEFEDELLLSPARRAFQVAQMAHLGNSAARARSEAEAEAFLGSLIPLAARLVPRIAPAVMRAAPALIRGVANVGRTILRSPAARPLVRAVPQIVQGTVANLARQAAQGRPLTAGSAVRTLAGQTYRTLATPARARAAVRRTQTLDRAYHARTGTRTCGCAG